MSVRVLPLAQSAFVADVEADVYVAPVSTIIDKCSSYGELAATVTLRIVPASASTGLEHQQAKHAFAIGDSYSWPELANQVLAAGDKITAVSTVASAVTLRISGRQVAQVS